MAPQFGAQGMLGGAAGTKGRHAPPAEPSEALDLKEPDSAVIGLSCHAAWSAGSDKLFVMVMQPRPMAETSRPLLPRVRLCRWSPFDEFDVDRHR
jgi:hypothetical protein